MGESMSRLTRVLEVHARLIEDIRADSNQALMLQQLDQLQRRVNPGANHDPDDVHVEDQEHGMQG